MGNLMSITTHNERNLCRLFLAIRQTGPVAVALAEIYLLLLQLAPGQTVRDYCQNILGYTGDRYRNIFTADERRVLAGPWDPKSKDVSLLYKLLRHVCGLSHDAQNWIDPSYPLEFYLHTAKNWRNDTMHSRSELTDAELQATLQELENSLTSAINLAGVRAGRDVSIQVSSFKSEIQSHLKYSFEKRELSRYLWPFRAIYQSIGTMYGAIGTIAPSTGNVATAAAATAAAATASLSRASILQSAGAVGPWIKDQSIQPELMKFIHEAEALELYGIRTIIRRKMKQK